MFNIFSLRFSCQQEFSEVIQTCKKETGEKENNESSMYKYMYILLCLVIIYFALTWFSIELYQSIVPNIFTHKHNLLYYDFSICLQKHVEHCLPKPPFFDNVRPFIGFNSYI